MVLRRERYALDYKTYILVCNKISNLVCFNFFFLQKPASSSAVNVEILNAKSEIENAPIVMNDSRLYSPLYRNVSMFRRYH